MMTGILRQQPELLVLVVDLDMDCDGQLHYHAFAENLAAACGQLVSNYTLATADDGTAAQPAQNFAWSYVWVF